ncbi:hypothetical protein CFP65_5774 [Kitasatospora sp. MMS16-BH015]|uniref:RHS repeat-associated core domain-containing protein n=1 Tax=Kitasatospora sp. MMS16-BH015 TaxID=2018025 RepID=UPI000CA28415|nr:RHS repeat-associated core domain-containing protein [Kitasatospora sp. MMS16-BH015]AUG80460.1 hypothetical protein CFP65_5774 [Kitasatospora sp. MMS16-BH015]
MSGLRRQIPLWPKPGDGRRLTSAAAVLAVTVSLLTAPSAEAFAAHQPHPKVWVPPKTPLPKTQSVPGANAPKPGTKGPTGPVPKNWQPAKAALPQAGSATISLPKTSAEQLAARAMTGGASPSSAGSAQVQAGQLPVWLADASDGHPAVAKSAAATAEAPAPSVKVELVDQAKAKAAGAPGPVLTLGSADATTAATGPVQVTLDMKALTGNAGWADRARLVELPACALTTPQLAACQKQTPVASSVDARTGQVKAEVTLPTQQTGGTVKSMASPAGSAAAPAMVLAATAAPSGSSGSFAASPISPSAAWSAGSNAGNFTYSYTLDAPTSLGGAAPSLSLGYDSSSVDGRTASTNSQSSWIGEGWDYQTGSVSRNYKPCISDGITNSGDECWAGQSLSLNLAGHSGQLVRDDSNGSLHLQGEDGTLVEPLTGLNNGAWHGEGFKVTTTDGTVYYFGANHLPGGDGTDPAANSVNTVPVYSPNSGDPCYSSSTGQASWCQMAWQWNLDYVVDLHGNLITYTYAQEGNYYSRGGGQNNGTGTLTGYTRASYPTQIGYGQRLADQIAAKGAAKPAVQVSFTTAERCLPSGSITCDPSQRTTANQQYWPDSPLDQNCASSGSCSVYGPTFWTTKRLTTIATNVLVSGAYRPVDSYALTQTFPDPGDGTQPTLWLSSIQRTGSNGKTPISLPAVSFTPWEIANRVDGLVPAAPQFNRPRMQQITTETGGKINVTYKPVECSRLKNTMPASADSNTMACMPVIWATPGSTTPVNDWFQKILVQEVTEQDSTTGAVAKVTDYAYGGGAAWHRNDSEFADDKSRTWDQFRGYQTVTTTTGNGGDGAKTQAVSTFLRGMDGDVLASGSTRSVSVPDSWGGSITDAPEYAGFVRETQSYTAAGGTVVGGELSTPWVGPVTATHTQNPTTLPKVTAKSVNTAQVKDRSLLSDGTWRTTERDATYDSAHAGRVLTSDVKGDLAHPEQEVCSSTTYASGANAQLSEYPSRVLTLSGACGQTPTAANTLQDMQTVYDGQQVGTIGQLAEQTETRVLASYDGSGNPVYRSTAKATFDVYGRQLSTTNPNNTDQTTHQQGTTTNTVYTPTTGELPRQVDVINPLGWKTTTTLDPGRAVPTRAVDENGYLTDEAYDALGRLTSVWLPGRDSATQTANRTFEYALNGTASPSTVTSHAIRENGSYTTSIQIYDGLGRVRQTQSVPVYGTIGRLITDANFDSHGWQIKASSAYYNSDSGPVGTVYAPQDAKVPAQTWNEFDGMGRVTAAKTISYGQEQWRTTTTYVGADRTDVTPPAGGYATSTITDATGATTALRQYKSNTPTGPYDETTFGYTPAGAPSWRKDSSGNTWTYSYDLLGEQTSSTDPDAGTSYRTYDSNGRLVTATDGRGVSTSFSYDLLGRKTGQYDGTSNTDSSKLNASWTYDTLAKGKPTSSTSYSKGSAYTTAVTGYDNGYRPTGASVTIPSVENGLAGTYTTTQTYSAVLGLPLRTTIGTTGAVPGERVTKSYDVDGNLLTTSGQSHLISDIQYDAFGKPTRTTIGPYGTQVVSTQVYDPGTGRVVQSTLDKQTAATASVDATTYTFNQAGSMTSVRDVQDGATADQQCFTYDYLGRLTAAWTDQGGATTQPAPSVSGIGACTNPVEPTTATASSRIGGPSPYWQSYAYDKTGNRTQLVQHDPTGVTSKDRTVNQTFGTTANTKSTDPKTGGGTGGPHALLTSSVITGGTTTQSTFTYDAAGNTTSLTNPTGTKNLTWDGQGKTATVQNTGAQVGTSYVYDADGNQLLRRDPGKVTLNLGADEVTLDTSSGAMTDNRYYSAPGGLTIARTTVTTTAGTAPSTLAYQASDPHGTNGIQFDAATLAQTRRPTDPFGNPRGTQPAAGTWVGDKGFVGGTQDDSTGLTNLGAREYDPSSGRFLATDPLFIAGDPQQWNGYAYANNNPIDHSDPSGTCIVTDDGYCRGPHDPVVTGGTTAPSGSDGSSSSTGTSAASDNKAAAAAAAAAALRQQQAAEEALAKAKQAREELIKKVIDVVGDLIGFNDARDCFTKGDVMGCINTALNFVPWGKVFKAVKVGIKAVKLWKEADKAYTAIHDAEKIAVEAEKGLVEARKTEKEAAEAEAAATKAEEGPTPETKSDTPNSEPSHAEEPSSNSSGETCNSFPAGTLVQLADGTFKAINALNIGDVVLATDPQTGTTKAEPVQATIVGHDDTTFTELTVTPAGDPAHGTTVTSTAHHPYWDVTTNRWTDATDLNPGDTLRQPDGSLATVTTVQRYQTTPQTAFNLTVAQLHTYYVLAGATPVLVHNCDKYDDLVSEARESGTTIDPKDKRKEYERAGRALEKHSGPGRESYVEGRWPVPEGKRNPTAWNALGRQVQDAILDNVDTVEHYYSRKYKSNLLDIRSTDGRGIRYWVTDGKVIFMGFLD